MVTLNKPQLRRDMRRPTRRRVPDVRDEVLGTFLGRVRPDAPVGSFANVRYLRRQGAGGYRGDPDRQRQGSFGDHDLADVDRSAEHERFVRSPDAA